MPSEQKLRKRYDPACLELAKYFYPRATAVQLDNLACDIQMIVEDQSNEMDPPWPDPSNESPPHVERAIAAEGGQGG